MNQSDINNITLSGRLIAQPQFRELPGSQMPICHMKLCNTIKTVEGTGEVKAVQHHINLVLYGLYTPLAENLTINDNIVIEGQLNIRSTSKTSSSTTTEVVVRRLYKLDQQPSPSSNDVDRWG